MLTVNREPSEYSVSYGQKKVLIIDLHVDKWNIYEGNDFVSFSILHNQFFIQTIMDEIYWNRYETLPPHSPPYNVGFVVFIATESWRTNIV